MSELNLTTDEARVSYGIGRQLGDQLRENPVPGMTLDAVLAGLSDAFAGIDSRVSGEALSASFQVIRERMQAEAQAKAEAAGWKGNELTVNADIIVLANPEIARLPNWVIALVAAGGLAAVAHAGRVC